MRLFSALCTVPYTITAFPISAKPLNGTELLPSLSIVNDTAAQASSSMVNLTNIPLTFEVPKTDYEINIFLPQNSREIPEMAMWLVLEDIAGALRSHDARTKVEDRFHGEALGFFASLLPLPFGKIFYLNCGDAALAVDTLWGHMKKYPVLMRSLAYSIELSHISLASGAIMASNDASEDGQAPKIENLTVS